MEKLDHINTSENLESAREEKLLLIQKVFKDVAVEGHLFGSIARGDTDAFSDIDIWLVIKDEDVSDTLGKRFEYYAKVGEVVHIVEPPQNSPIGGVQSAVLYKTQTGLLIVDYSLCPQSTAFITKESKKLFGEIDLPIGEAGFNSQKVAVPESYRIDFFIGFIFNGIKKIIRKDVDRFDHMLKEYEYLSSRYNLPITPLENKEPTFTTLKEIIKNVYGLSTEKQKGALLEIENFMEKVEKENKENLFS